MSRTAEQIAAFLVDAVHLDPSKRMSAVAERWPTATRAEVLSGCRQAAELAKEQADAAVAEARCLQRLAAARG